MIIADSSPLIALARIGQLELLRELYVSVAIPPAVRDEIERRPGGFEGGRPNWIELRRVDNLRAITRFRSRLDRGESEVIALAEQLGLPVLMDEADGRRAAMSAGLTVVGTLGMLILAKRAGKLDRVDSAIARLQVEGFRMSPALAAEALRLAGED